MRETTGQRQVLGRGRHFIKRAVHAVADLELVLERLEMNVAGAVLHRLEQNEVDEPHDRDFVGDVGQDGRIVGLGGGGGFLGDARVIAEFLEDVRDAFAVSAIIPLDGLFNLRGVRHHQLDVLADDKTEFIGALGIQRDP